MSQRSGDLDPECCAEPYACTREADAPARPVESGVKAVNKSFKKAAVLFIAVLLLSAACLSSGAETYPAAIPPQSFNFVSAKQINATQYELRLDSFITGKVELTISVTDILGGDFLDEQKRMSLDLVEGPNKFTLNYMIDGKFVEYINSAFGYSIAIENIVYTHEDYKYYAVNGQAMILSYIGQGENIVLPETLDGNVVRNFCGLCDYDVYDAQTDTHLSCRNLTSVTVPAGITIINTFALGDADNLTSINVDEKNPNYTSIDGVLFNKDKTGLLACPYGKTGEYVIPDGVEYVDSVTGFWGCFKLTGITVPNSVAHIYEGTFKECSSLKRVTFLGLTSFDDGRDIFYGCPSDIVMSGPERSPAQRYADKRDIEFEIIEGDIPSFAPSPALSSKPVSSAPDISSAFSSAPSSVDTGTRGISISAVIVIGALIVALGAAFMLLIKRRRRETPAEKP
ncbi:MAG TPA: hypothetical protein DEQ02_08605 [Ruminococcaceae bacterium]|nr:hypothetical protein [Oscillospiraceae bacterium]